MSRDLSPHLLGQPTATDNDLPQPSRQQVVAVASFNLGQGGYNQRLGLPAHFLPSEEEEALPQGMTENDAFQVSNS